MTNMKWLKNEVIEGIQRLTALRLQNSPAADLMPGTVEVWFDVISTRPIQWNEELDKHRVKSAFRELCATCERWPTPTDFIRLLPPRKPPLMLPHKEVLNYPEETKRMVSELIEKLNANKKTDQSYK